MPKANTMFPRWNILGLHVCVADPQSAIGFVIERLETRSKTLIAFANTNLLKCARAGNLEEALSDRFVIFNDGVGLNLLARICCGRAPSHNLNGTDFTTALLEALPDSTRIFLVGTKPEILERTKANLVRRHGITICGKAHGYLSTKEMKELPTAVNAARADLVMVGLGNPKQELWMMEHENEVNAPILMGVGAFLDFAAGAVPRAPAWIQQLRLEWMFRLYHEPARLWRRYTVDILALAAAAVRSRL